MALIIAASRSGQLSPESRLSQALGQFELVLSDDQRKDWKAVQQASPPGIDSVISLTAEIGHSCSLARGRQLAPRLTKFLTGVQVLTSGIDLIIGGSQNLVASGVWGVLKTALQAASQNLAFFEKLSKALQDLTQSVPDITGLVQLFPRASSLRAAYCEYVIAVVSLCTKIVSFLKGSKARQALQAAFLSFDSEFGEILNELHNCGTTIERRVQIASEQHHQEERLAQSQDREERSLIRKLQQTFSTSAANELSRLRNLHRQEARVRFLQSCSTYDSQRSWRQFRRRGNADWIFQNPDYQDWLRRPLESSLPMTLCCSGALGSGKTVVAANVLEQLLMQRGKTIVGYHFCRRDEEASLWADTIIRSLCRQIFEVVLSNENFDDFGKPSIAPTTEQLCERLDQELVKRLTSFSCAILVIDDLEACSADEIAHFREFLSGLNFPAKVFFTIRSSSQQKATGALGLKPNFHVDMNRARDDQELEAFITAELEARLVDGRLKIRQPHLIVLIQDTLVEKVHGMYLWLHFQLNSICAQPSDNAIVEALARLPESLPETFDRIVARIAGHSSQNVRDKCSAMFDIIFAAKELLTSEEVSEALNIRPGIVLWDPASIVNDMARLIDDCEGFLILEEDDQTIQFAHHSIVAHLYPTTEARAKAIERLGGICATYLCLPNHEKSLAQRSDTDHTPINVNLTEAIGASAARASGNNSAAQIAVRFLKFRSRHQKAHDITKFLPKAIEQFEHEPFWPGYQNTWCFKNYASRHWLEHTANLSPDETLFKDQVAQILHKDLSADLIGALLQLQHALCFQIINNNPNLITMMRDILYDSSSQRRMLEICAQVRTKSSAEFLLPHHRYIVRKKDSQNQLDEGCFFAADTIHLLYAETAEGNLMDWLTVNTELGLPIADHHGAQLPELLWITKSDLLRKVPYLRDPFALNRHTKTIWRHVEQFYRNREIDLPQLNDNAPWDLHWLDIASNTGNTMRRVLHKGPQPIKKTSWIRSASFWPFETRVKRDAPATVMPLAYFLFRAIASHLVPAKARPELDRLLLYTPEILDESYDGLTVHHWAEAFGHIEIALELRRKAEDRAAAKRLLENLPFGLDPIHLRLAYTKWLEESEEFYLT